MSKQFQGLLELSMVVLQLYVGLVLLLTPEKAHLGHYIVAIGVSLPILVQSIRQYRNNSKDE
jgi:uncharacterized membrane protein (DUF485 family)